MGKIKKFVTGLFSKKKAGDEEEIIQIQPIEAPDRDFIEHESRYDTPDYQAFLNDMGYINAEEKRVNSSEETDDTCDAAAEDYNEADETIDAAAEDPAEAPVYEVDQDFIDEGVAELGVNDVWSEEED